MSEPTTRRGIVVGVDGSDPCRAAVRWAARDAAMRNAPFTLVHVVNVRYTTMPQTSLPVGFGGWLEEQGQTFLEEVELDREGQWSFAGRRLKCSPPRRFRL